MKISSSKICTLKVVTNQKKYNTEITAAVPQVKFSEDGIDWNLAHLPKTLSQTLESEEGWVFLEHTRCLTQIRVQTDFKIL